MLSNTVAMVNLTNVNQMINVRVDLVVIVVAAEKEGRKRLGKRGKRQKQARLRNLLRDEIELSQYFPHYAAQSLRALPAGVVAAHSCV